MIKNALLGGALLALGIVASASATNAAIIVPGTSDIWAWNGIAPPDDQMGSPTVDISPVLALSGLAGIHSVTITATGETGNCPGCDVPNGAGGVLSHEDGAYNGIPDLNAPLNSLIGAWVNPTNAQDDMAFEIGTEGMFFVPNGATELFLGSMDGYQWNNNEGQFSVDVTANSAVPEPFTLSLFGAGIAGVVILRRRKKA
jgi:hypothetical protein